jgi:ssRNA-specific RNase YbeY (16S rRNA maturation enzyme)
MKPGNAWIMINDGVYMFSAPDTVCSSVAPRAVGVVRGDVIICIGFLRECRCSLRHKFYDKIVAFLTPHGVVCDHYSTADNKIRLDKDFLQHFCLI